MLSQCTLPKQSASPTTSPFSLFVLLLSCVLILVHLTFHSNRPADLKFDSSQTKTQYIFIGNDGSTKKEC